MNKTIMDRMPTTPDVNQERLEQLRALMPDLFTNDGALNPDELKRLIDPNLVPETGAIEPRPGLFVSGEIRRERMGDCCAAG